MDYDTSFRVNGHGVGHGHPTYVIANIGANHDGDLERAKALIWLAKDAGAQAVKFQHFRADGIVSRQGFERLGRAMGHQEHWDKPVYDMFVDHELDRSWNETLAATASEAGVDFVTSPYDRDATDDVAPLVAALKIGSGDITWIQSVAHIASKGLPTFLSTGASSFCDVERAVATVLKHNRQLCLLQCNTNYNERLENFRFMNLRVLQYYALVWPGLPLGLSDHTPGHAAALGAIALGARVIEKHLTDDPDRTGPDHGVAMTPHGLRNMVDRARELEAALGDGVKRIEENERETVIIQRRALHLTRAARAGEPLTSDMLEALRPAPPGAFAPYHAQALTGRILAREKARGEPLLAHDLLAPNGA